MKCQKCGHEFEGKFCPECGTPVAAPAAEPAAPVPAPAETEKLKKKNHGCLIAIVVFVIIGIIGAGMSSEDSTSSGSASSSVETPAPTVDPTAAPTEEPTPESTMEAESSSESDANSDEPLMSMDMTAAVIEALVSQNFENYKIDYDDSGITLSLWQDGLAVGSVLASAGYEDSIESWNTIKDSLITFCDSVSESMETAGHGDATIMINVLNDQNTDKILLSALNGVIIYDVVNE